ncbi:hypothetical protein HIDPHFAB_00001 [Nocardioides sp. T2.26MG-1]|nr:hypothetical protein HIDPHFAB_00001 [Nocardioides sp. T2.26MG-1]
MHQQCVGALEGGDGVGGRLGGADRRQRGRHVLADRVGQPRRTRVEQVEQGPLRHRPDHLGGDDRRLGPHDRHLGDVVLLQDRDGLGDRLVRVRVHEVGQPAALAAQHLPDRLDGALGTLDGEPVLRQPVVVEHLGQVAAARVGQQYDDHRILTLGRAGELVGELHRGVHGHAGGAADQQRLLAGQPPGGRERVGVGDLDDPVRDVAVVGLGPEVLAHALDQVGPPGAAGVDRPGRVRAHDLHGGALLLEVAADPGDRPAGADAGDEVGDLALGLRPDLGAGGLVVRPRVVRVGVLVRLPGARLGGQPVGDVVVGVGVLGLDRGRAHDDLRAVRLEHVALVLTDLVGADEDALVALLLRDHRQPDARVAGRRLHDRAPGLELAGRLSGLDHPGRDAVLHGAAGVEVLHLGEDDRSLRAGQGAHGLREPEQRGVADQVEE